MSRVPDPASEMEEEGIPDLGDPDPAQQVTGDAGYGLSVPRDQATAVDDYGTTAAEEHEGEPLDLRVSREEPDPAAEAGAADPLTVGDREEPPGDDDPFPRDDELRTGRVVEPDEGARTDAEKDAVARDVGTDVGGFSAEERAMHIDEQA